MVTFVKPITTLLLLHLRVLFLKDVLLYTPTVQIVWLGCLLYLGFHRSNTLSLEVEEYAWFILYLKRFHGASVYETFGALTLVTFVRHIVVIAFV